MIKLKLTPDFDAWKAVGYRDIGEIFTESSDWPSVDLGPIESEEARIKRIKEKGFVHEFISEDDSYINTQLVDMLIDQGTVFDEWTSEYNTYTYDRHYLFKNYDDMVKARLLL